MNHDSERRNRHANVAELPRERLHVLTALSHALDQPRDVEELFRTVYRQISPILDTTGFIGGLYDEVGQTVTVVYQVDSGNEIPGGSFPLGNGFTSQAIRTRQPRLIRHWSVEGPRVQIQYATSHEGLPESGITVPLIVGEQALGVISVQSYSPESYDEEDLLTLQVVASQTAKVISNLRRAFRLEAQLQRQVSDLETVLASMSEALLIIDTGGRIKRLNAAARTLLCPGDGTTSVILGQPLDQEQWGQWPLGARVLGKALKPLVEAVRRGESVSDLEVTLHLNGRRVISFSCAPLREPAGTLAGGVIIFRDVTSRREIERLKDDVLSIASHDLKGPISLIKGYAQILQRQMESGEVSGETFAHGLATIVHETNRMVELLDLLLDLSRVEAGRLDLHKAPMDLVALLTPMVGSLQGLTERHRLVLSAPQSVEGIWDQRRLGQLFQNLLTNALKYSPDGGSIEVNVCPKQTRVVVSIRDDGVGLAPEDIPHIFDRFYRAQETRRLEGSGLGLFICGAIVSAHRGRIWAESEGIGHGTTFKVVLPRSAPARLDGHQVSP